MCITKVLGVPHHCVDNPSPLIRHFGGCVFGMGSPSGYAVPPRTGRRRWTEDEDFFETCSETFKEVLDEAAGDSEDFGDRHADTLTSAAKFVGTTAASVAVGAVTRGAGHQAEGIWQAKSPGA